MNGCRYTFFLIYLFCCRRARCLSRPLCTRWRKYWGQIPTCSLQTFGPISASTVCTLLHWAKQLCQWLPSNIQHIQTSLEESGLECDVTLVKNALYSDHRQLAANFISDNLGATHLNSCFKDRLWAVWNARRQEEEYQGDDSMHWWPHKGHNWYFRWKKRGENIWKWHFFPSKISIVTFSIMLLQWNLAVRGRMVCSFEWYVF